MNVSEYICDFLKNNGVSQIFVVSGGHAMYLNDALGRQKEIRSICVHHEQVAGMAAEVYGRLTGVPGVAMVTAGPGSINILTGLVGGWTDSAPMMVISGQSAYSCVTYQKQSGIRQCGIQGINVKPFVETATKFFITVDDPSKIRYYLEKAFYLTTHGRPGPVWLDVPLDIQRMQVPEGILDAYIPELEYLRNSDIQISIKKTIDALLKSSRPLLMAGQGVALSDARDALRNVIEKFDIPLITSRLGIDLIESSHPLYVGRPGNYGERAANFAIQNADLIIAVGSRLASATVGHDPGQFGKNAKKIVVDIDAKELDKPGVHIDLKINEDARVFLSELFKFGEKISLPKHDEWTEKCRHWKNSYPVLLPEYKKSVPINSYYFADRLSDLAGSDDVIVVDIGSCFHVASQTWKIKRGQRFISNGGFASMGYWAAGIGACAARDFKNTIVITGDGSFQMNIQELATIKHGNLPIKIFILNNDGYLLIRQTQKNFVDGRLFGEGPGSGVWCPDSMKIAKAYGIKGVRIEKPEEMEDKLREVLSCKHPVICEIMTDPWQLLIPRVSSDKAADGTLISRRYEDMFPYLPDDELKSNMIADDQDKISH